MKQLSKSQMIDLAKRLAKHLEVEGVIIMYMPKVETEGLFENDTIGGVSYGANRDKCRRMGLLMDDMIDAVTR